MSQLVWCVNCQRVWRTDDLAGTWPALVCPDLACNGGAQGSFMPYEQTRRLIAGHWPTRPSRGERLRLRPRHAAPSC